MKNKICLPVFVFSLLIIGWSVRDTGAGITSVNRPSTQTVNQSYVGSKALVLPLYFIKLPSGSIQQQGWVKKYLCSQRDGLIKCLGKIGAWLDEDFGHGDASYHSRLSGSNDSKNKRLTLHLIA